MTTLFSRVVRALVVSVAALTAVQAAAQTADLSVTQTPSRSVMAMNGDFTVAVVATNHGPATTNATVTYAPVGGTPLSASGPGWTCQAVANAQVRCTYVNLGAGSGTQALSVSARATTLGPQKYTSRTVVSSQPATDTVSDNDTAESVHDVKYFTTTYLEVSSSPSVAGEPAKLTARIYSPPVTSSSGNVVFKDGPTVLATVPVSNGAASFTTSDLPTGARSLTAEYSGATNYLPSAVTKPHNVVLRTTTTLTSAANPAEYGAASLTATVASSSGTPSGYVQIMTSPRIPPLAKVALSNGSATWRPGTSLRNAGTYNLYAVYVGTSNYAMSTSATISQVVNKGHSTTTVSASSASYSYGQSVTFTARVAGTFTIPTGSVLFKRNGVSIASVTLSRATTDAFATLTTSAIPAGTSDITAVYVGTSNYNPSTSSAVAISVSKAETSTVLTTSLNPSSFGQTITYSASVTSATGAPVPGVVNFYRGTTLAGTATLRSGTATYATAAIGAGSHAVHAVYMGNANFISSTSNTISQVVDKSASSTTLASSTNPSLSGDSITLTAAVAGAYGGTVTGTVTFKAGEVTLRTISLSRGVAAYATSSLPAGTHSLTATYNGSANLLGSGSSALEQTVQRRPNATITALTALCTSSIGNTASVPAQSGVTYQWSIEGGTITAGAGTNRITFSAPSWGYVTLTANLSCAECASASDTHTIQLGSGVGVGSRDLSGDGLNDLVWQNRSTGATEVWAMNGSTPISVVGIYSPPAGWLVEGVADVNQDGKADLLYRNQQTGAAMAWLMNNLSYIGSITFAAPTDLSWKLGGIADFNCDGYQDVVWRKTNTGENAVWLMSGNTLLSVVPLPSISTGWTLAGVGDFTTDGRADLVWRRTTDGKTAIWTMNSTTATSTLYPPAQPDLNWSLQAIADYSKDGRPDLVWRNATTGANEIWVMDGITRTSIVPLTPVYDTNRHIGGPR